MATIKEIAKLASVSTATVSHVLNKSPKISSDTRERVLKVIKELNYKPNSIAKSLKIKKTNTVGIISEDITVFNTPEIINGINEYAEKQNYHIILNNIRLVKRIGNNYKDIARYRKIISEVVDVLVSKQVEGIIYIGAHCRDVTDLIGEVDVPVVYTYCYSTSDNAVSVNYNDETAAYEMTKYLLELGHKKIGILTGRQDSKQCQDRLSGYHKALFDHHVLFNPDYMKNGDWERGKGYLAGKELLLLPDPPTAIFAFNDIMAGGVIDAANELGLMIPRDLSLVGFDNRECSEAYTPKLTTMAIPLNDMGNLSSKILIEIIEGSWNNTENAFRLNCKLMERNSTRPNNDLTK